MRLFPSRFNCCGADVTKESSVSVEVRGKWNGLMGKESKVLWGRIRAKRIFHRRGEEYFWHWSDQVDDLAEGYGRVATQ